MRPWAFVVLRLIINSTLVRCWINLSELKVKGDVITASPSWHSSDPR
jgi:hypothetical protein